MQIPKIQIHTQRAETGISQNRPSMSIRQQQADLDIKQDLAGSFRLSSTASKLFIDQSEAFADAGSIPPLRRASNWAASTKQSVMQYIAKVARQGEQLKKIENGGNAIVGLAKENGERRSYEVGLGYVPKTAFKVRFNYVPSEVSVDIDWKGPQIRFKKNEPNIHIPRWESNVYLQQKNAISFSVSGSHVNKQL
ncbi:DUF6470 family protein [Evansella sp. AB-rgal1]|uniref:DUF6470 family protein n=1 Tax=Evansella sp. AB-rgal1 TaxID=3242696 RepID=UPI00359ED3F3